VISELLLDSFCVLEKNILLCFFALELKPAEAKTKTKTKKKREK